MSKINLLFLISLFHWHPIIEEFNFQLDAVEVFSYTEKTSLSFIMKLESYTRCPKWDINDYRAGYGTSSKKCLTKEEAFSEMKIHWNKGMRELSWIPYSKRMILLSTWYNTGNFGCDLDNAIMLDDYCEIQNHLLRYVKTEGKINRGLIKRRQSESFKLEKCYN